MTGHDCELPSNNDDVFFGQWLRRRRRGLDFTQDALAQRVGCVVDTVRKLEAGLRRPSHTMAERLAQCLAIPLEAHVAFVAAARAGRAPPDLAAPPVAPPLSATASRTGYLPAAMTMFIGREWEIAAIAARLRTPEVRLVTLTAAGGIGKTRLALQVAGGLHDAFPQGVWFVNLAPVSDSALVIPAIAQVLGVREQHGIPIVDTVRAALRSQRLLLVLDNFEHLVAVAPVITVLLADLPGLTALVTSREALRLSGEHVVVVAPLAVPDPARVLTAAQLTPYAAVRLFVERAQAVAEYFCLTDVNAAVVAAICARLDGLPLAIELAAARVPLFPPVALLTRLERRLPLLTHGLRDAPARQQTLRDTIDWSYHLLDPDEQILFARLGVFVGCTLEAAEAVGNVAGDLGADVLDTLAALVDQSLVRQDEGLDAEPRFSMLETIREYAVERLEQSGQAEAIRRRHAEYFLSLGEAAELQLHGPVQLRWLDRLEQEHDNLRAVLTWSQMSENPAEVGLQLTGLLWWFWFVRGYLREGSAWLEQALARSTASTLVRATALLRAGWLAFEQHDSVRATTLLEESLALHHELGDRRGVAWSLSFLGGAARGEQAVTLLEESLALHHELGDRRGVAWSLIGLGREAWLQHDFVRAVPLLEEGLRVHRELGDIRNIAWALFFLAGVTIAPERAVALFEESLALHQKLSDTHGIMSALNRLGWLAHNQGDDGRAESLFLEILAVTREQGNKHATAWSLNALGELARSRNDDAAARVYYGESLTLRQELQDTAGIALVRHNLGYVALHQGAYGQAAALFAESLLMYQEHGDQADIGNCIDGLAGVAAVTGQPLRAARLFGAAEAHCTTMRDRLEPVDQVEHERSLAAARAHCDEVIFAAAWAAGQRMSLEQAIAEALESQ